MVTLVLAVLFGMALGASLALLATRGQRRETLVVDAPEIRRWLAERPKIRMVTTTMREVK